MLSECIEGLNIDPNGIYTDLTFGGGGHSREILKHISGGHLYAFDQDEDAAKNAVSFNKRSFTFIEGNFRYLKRYLKAHGVNQVDGILADLGISSHQIDEASRGFSTRFDSQLDMRMDTSSVLTAHYVVNNYTKERLHKIFGMYGEVRNAKTLAEAITSARINQPVDTVAELKQILSKYAKRGRENRYYAQVFQAIRIEVNQELQALEEMLLQCVEVLRPGGRLVVMSYHSLEDRPIKNLMMRGDTSGHIEKDFYGNVIKPLKVINRKPIEATEEERAKNNRARSAKLRIAEKL